MSLLRTSISKFGFKAGAKEFSTGSQAYAGGKWQNEVNKCDKSDGSYAGILCVPLEFVKLTNTK